MKFNMLLAAVAAVFSSTVSAREPLAVGELAPKLTVTADDGKQIDLAEVFASGLTLVYFYPRADTPGCTKQACSLRDAYVDLQESGVTVLGVSTDGVADQAAFRAKYSLPFQLIADESGELVKAFGVGLRGTFASRQAFLIKQGKVVWRDLKASTAKQAADVKKALQAL